MPRFEYAIDALSYEISKGDSEFSNQEHVVQTLELKLKDETKKLLDIAARQEHRRNELKRLETLEVEDFDSWNSH